MVRDALIHGVIWSVHQDEDQIKSVEGERNDGES